MARITVEDEAGRKAVKWVPLNAATMAKAQDDFRALLEVLTRIKPLTHEMFAPSFEAIRQHFSARFVEVFGGGKADLRLVDETDVLGSGIDIVARPPGKQLERV